MDRYHREKGWRKFEKLKTILTLFGILLLSVLLLSLWDNALYAEMEAQLEKKIELEKLQIFGVVERPNVVFPVRWKDPENPEERVYNFKRSFKEEIFDFVDVEDLWKYSGQ